MNIKTSYIIIFMILVFAIIIIAIYEYKPQSTSFPVSSETPELNMLDYSHTCLLVCPEHPDWFSLIPREKSMVNVIHITKNDNNYQISCEFGPSYSRYKYINLTDLPVYRGQVRTCDEQTAKVIDEAIRIKEDCIFPLSSSIPQNLNDYYAVLLIVNNATVPPDSIRKCHEKIIDLTKLEPSDIYSTFTFVADLKNKVLYP